MAKQRVVSARVVFETDPRNLNATDAYVRQALKSAFRGLKNANSAIAIFDENDRLVGMDAASGRKRASNTAG